MSFKEFLEEDWTDRALKRGNKRERQVVEEYVK